MIHEREVDAREYALTVFEAWCPFVAENPYIPHWPTPRQAKLLGLHLKYPEMKGEIFEALYGGAAGGGKSDALLMAAVQYAWKNSDYSGVCLRRTYAELAQPDALMDRALQWWLPVGAHWNGTDKIFTFPNGARVKMGYHNHPSHNTYYQGAAYQFAGWDELTHWPDDRAYKYVSMSRLRRLEGSTIPLRALSTSNPGGPGHTWVQERFIGKTDIVTGEYRDGLHPYVPARIDDNPHLDRETYIRSLMRLHPTVRAQLLNGDWSAREPGDYFRVEWFGPLLDPEFDLLPRGEYIEVRWWDLAASERENAARTAGVKMARLRSGVRVVTHAVAFRATPGARDARIVQQARLDGQRVIVGIEIEPGSGGVAQFDTLSRQLRKEGVKIVGARPKVEISSKHERKQLVRHPRTERGKAGRADPVASCLERGYQRRGEGGGETGDPWWGDDIGRPLDQQRDGLRLYAGPWTQGYLDEVEPFPEVALLDLVDATSGAWAYLEAHPFGLRIAPSEIAITQAVESADIHPEDRASHMNRDTVGRDKTGHWRQ